MDKISEIIREAIDQLFDVVPDVQLTRPDKKFGDFATNISLQLTAKLSQPPMEIAKQLVEELQKNTIFENVSAVAPGFINLKVKARVLADSLNNGWNNRYGSNNDGDDKTVIVEYPSPNIAKPYSVGHLRPGNQGWAIKRLMEETGWKVITDNHLGDYGAPFGIWVTGYLKFSSPEKLEKDGVYELGRVYIEMRQALKSEAEAGKHELADEVQDWLLKLEDGDEEAQKYSDKFSQISLDHIHGMMKRLKISTDYELGESFFVASGKNLVKSLVEENLAVRNDDNSIIIELNDQGIDVPMLIQKSNGAALYATTDLACLKYREETWHPDRVIYAVAAEQKFYFEQLFAVAKKMGIKTELIHLWFGLIDQINEDGSRAKMSSRKGVVLMEELLDKAEVKAREIVNGREVSDEDVSKIALGAIKFSDFTSDRRTNILFNWDSIFALSGFSGPYVQYATVRVNKILSDGGNGQGEISDYDYEAEKDIILKLLEYPYVIELAGRNLEPHKIATYLYELARELNRYYETTPIMTSGVGETDKTARLGLLAKASQVLTHGLNILGIEVPNRM